MRRLMLGGLVLWLTASCFGQSLCPRHIEMPAYPPEAAIGALQGKVTLTVTVDTDGNVKKVDALSDTGLLQKSAIENMRHWTFEKPPSAAVTQVITYEYKFDDSLPLNDHQNPITKVIIDLPNRVSILHNLSVINPSLSKKKKR